MPPPMNDDLSTDKRDFLALITFLDATSPASQHHTMKPKPNPEKAALLPEAFIQFWRCLCERSRSLKHAHRELVKRWENKEAIPGYGPAYSEPLPAASNLTGLPRGWSFRSLVRYAPAKSEPSRTKVLIARVEKGVHLSCPDCRVPILHMDIRCTATLANSAEVTATCSKCKRDVLYGYVDKWEVKGA